MNDVIHDTELRVFGQKRCGHHAIMAWLGLQLGRETFVFNDCKPFDDPYRTHTNTPPFVWKYPQLAQNGSAGRDAEWVPFTTVEQEAERIKTLRFVKKTNVIFSFEDFELHHYGENIIPVEFVGRCRRRFNVIVLRDPFNHLASLMGISHKFPHVTFNYSFVISNWKRYAQEYLGETNNVPEKLCILYNRWFLSREYRDEICAKLGVRNHDAGLEVVPPNGTGSSFDGLKFDGKAQSMLVLHRWRKFATHPDFLIAACDTELRGYSDRLFGRVI
jgi:hypothetical protein